MLRHLPLRWPTALLVTSAPAGTSGAGQEPAPPPATAATDVAHPRPAVDGRRRFRFGSLAGAVLAVVPTMALLVGGGFFRRRQLGGFYDAQAHSLLDLRWDVPPQVLSLEAFVVDGRSYMYFGPTPAVLRLPVAAITDRFDGRLTSLSLLLALVVALGATTALGWRVRCLVRGQAPVSGVDVLAAAATTFLVGSGSVLLLLSSAPVVYHEAIAWGVALTLSAYAALIAYVTDRRPRMLTGAVALATAAVLARPSVGLGPVLALMALAAAEGLTVLRSSPGGRRWRRCTALVLGAVIPVVAYTASNFVKFDTPVGVPWKAQAASQFDPDRQAFLRKSDGTLFGARYAPTGLFQYARPDALSVDRAFPWVDFPRPAVRLFDVPFDVVDRSSSATATMPWLVVLALVGSVALVRRREALLRARAALWAPVLGALLAVPVTVGIAYIAHRYLADFVPLLLLLALVGLEALRRRGDGGRARATLLVVAGLGVVGVAVNLALGIQYQGLYGPAAGDAERARLVRWQTTADDLLPGDQSPRFDRLGPDEPLPRRGQAGDLVVVGGCDALYQYTGSSWRPVEQTPEAGRVRLRTHLGAPGPGGSAELVAGGSGADSRSLTVEVGKDGRGTFVLRFGGETVRGDPVELPAETETVDATFDRRLSSVVVEVDGQVVVGGVFYAPLDDAMDISPQWPGRVERVGGGTPACDGLVD